MMATFIFYKIFFAFEACLPCSKYAFDFNRKLVFDGIHIRSHSLLPVSPLFVIHKQFQFQNVKGWMWPMQNFIMPRVFGDKTWG